MTGYTLTMTPDADGAWRVHCPALPEVSTCASDKLGARMLGRGQVMAALQARIRAGREIPPFDAGLVGANVPTVVAPIDAMTRLKLALYEAARARGVTRAELARQLAWPRTAVERLFDLEHLSRLDQVEEAARALGRPLVVGLAPG